MDVDARTIVAFLEHGRHPGAIVIPHALWHLLHALDVEEDHGPLGKALLARAADRVDAFHRSALGAQIVGVAGRALSLQGGELLVRERARRASPGLLADVDDGEAP